MINYVPFLKYKANEIGAVKALDPLSAKKLSIFFDLPMQDNATEEKLVKSIVKWHRKHELNLLELESIYIDDYDIPDTIQISGKCIYKHVLSVFDDIDFIPVVGIDRSDERNSCVFEAKELAELKSDTVAVRVTPDDIAAFAVYRVEIESLIDQCRQQFGQVHIILDNRVCLGADEEVLTKNIVDLMNDITVKYPISKIVVAGSSIPASIADIAPTSSRNRVFRKELEIFRRIAAVVDYEIAFGDYTVVSPDYSDVDLPKEYLRNVMTAKIIYTFEGFHYVMRGASIEQDERRAKQYFDLCEELVREDFFRSHVSTYGEDYIVEKSTSSGVCPQPNSILKPLINSHIEFMVSQF